MRYSLKLTMCALLGVSLCGCEPVEAPSVSADGAAAGGAETVEPSKLQQVQREIEEAVQATSQYTAEQKEKCVADLKQRLEGVDASLEELKEDASNLSADAKQRWQQGLSDIESKRDELREQLADLSDASGDAWSELKVGFKDAWQDLGNSVEKAAEAFKK